MNEIFVTVNGTVGTDVQLTSGEHSNRARFRLATAERYFDRASNEWVERETVWLDVICFRRLADHVAASVVKGQPVIVRGRLGSRTGRATRVRARRSRCWRRRWDTTSHWARPPSPAHRAPSASRASRAGSARSFARAHTGEQVPDVA